MLLFECLHTNGKHLRQLFDNCWRGFAPVGRSAPVWHPFVRTLCKHIVWSHDHCLRFGIHGSPAPKHHSKPLFRRCFLWGALDQAFREMLSFGIWLVCNQTTRFEAMIAVSIDWTSFGRQLISWCPKSIGHTITAIIPTASIADNTYHWSNKLIIIATFDTICEHRIRISVWVYVTLDSNERFADPTLN